MHSNLHNATKQFTPHGSFSLRYQEMSVTFKQAFVITEYCVALLKVQGVT